VLLTAEQLRGVATCGYHVTQPRHVTPSLHRLSTGLSKVPVLAHLESNANLIAETPEAKWRNCCGYPMTDPTGAAKKMVCHGSHPYTPVMLAYTAVWSFLRS